LSRTRASGESQSFCRQCGKHRSAHKKTAEPDESTPHSTYGPLDFCSGHDEICRGIARRSTYDDRRPIYVRRREAIGALLMHGADSFAAEAAADTYKCPQSRH